jgi:lipopolysaccharide/colanic/teichoic acid biosynthesis glycosyltransferase
MARRLVEILLSSLALVVLSPILGVAALGIRMASSGPILYGAKRVGLYGRLFTMYKFRTMDFEQPRMASAISVKNDPRVFGFGSWLRRLKIDELPQLLNILKGDMSIVGPRPEDPEMVRKYYRPDYWETLDILPGLASPGSIYHYTHGEDMLSGDGAEECYGAKLLPIKIALDRVYVRDRSFMYDCRIVLRTIGVIIFKLLGMKDFPEPGEMKQAMGLGQEQSRTEAKVSCAALAVVASTSSLNQGADCLPGDNGPDVFELLRRNDASRIGS